VTTYQTIRKENHMEADGRRELLFVPVRPCGQGVLALRTARLPSGQQVGLAFTGEESLLSVLGPGQPWIRLHVNAMRDMLRPAGVDHIRVDPSLLTAPEATSPRKAGDDRRRGHMPHAAIRAGLPAPRPVCLPRHAARARRAPRGSAAARAGAAGRVRTMVSPPPGV
jgi:hypothetical protein